MEENQCKIKCDPNLYFKDGTCVACDGVVSPDFKECKKCDSSKTSLYQYFKEETKLCTDCVGTIVEADYPKVCDPCGANKNFNRTTKTCESCNGVVTTDNFKCDPCPATAGKYQYFKILDSQCTDCVGTLENVDLPTKCNPCTSS